MVTGLNKSEWKEAIANQNKHLQVKYDYKIDTDKIDANEMNKKANEVA